MQKIIDIIVVNWNSGILTLKALTPYYRFQSELIRCNTIVVDNASSDNSHKLLEGISDTFLANIENKGFGHACNQAFKYCKGDYILLLNPDTESTPAVLEKLVLFMENNPGYAVAGPQQTNEQFQVMKTCGRFPVFSTALWDLLGLSKKFPSIFSPAPIMLDWNHDSSRNVDHVMGSYMLLKKEVLNITGFMDPKYFVYYEDLDLSKRIREAGYSTYYNADAKIIHIGGASGNSAKSLRLFYSISARRIYWKKYFTGAAYYTLLFISVLVEPWLRILEIFVREKTISLSAILSPYARYLREIFRQGNQET